MSEAPARLPIVGVLGSGTQGHAARAAPLGRWLAGEGVHLLTGGGGGVMRAVSRAFCETPGRRGLSLGILPAAEGRPEAPLPGYPNPWVELAIRTHLPLRGARGREPLSRSHINVLSSDALVALPGGAGTAGEVALALAYGRPLVAWLDDPSQREGLPEAALVERDLAGVQAYVRRALRR